nr:NAD(P)/FAD-dependent oxidoreductase [Virgibacillus pantothenticus]
MDMEKKNIVVLGAGYGGMMTVTKLQRSLRTDEAKITLVNINEYHYQTTWLHQNAAGTIRDERTKIRIKDIIHPQKVDFIQDKVLSIQPKEKKVMLENTVLDYDVLVIGLGFEVATFDIPGLEEHAFTINNIKNARQLREHIEHNFAVFHKEEEKNPARLTFVIGGGGFTGIEFLGELANRVPELCEKYNVDKQNVRIINIEGSSTILPGFDEQLVEYAMNSLEARGVEFITGAILKECTPTSVLFEKHGMQTKIPTYTTVWAAGVKANSIIKESGFTTNQGKIEVNNDMRSPEYDNVFVIGDCALIMDFEKGKPYPPTAQIAIQESEAVAYNIKAYIRNQEMEGFKPNILGTVASLGEQDAIGVIFKSKKILGWKATVMKKIIDNRYLLKLGGFRLLLKKGKFNIFPRVNQ